MQTAKSVPQINGRDLKLVPLSGPAGEFEIAAAGTRKDGEAGFFYRDARADFFFLAELNTAAKPPRWAVFSATTGAWAGSRMRFSAQDVAAFEQNIRYFFQTRLGLSPSRPADAETSKWQVVFEWCEDYS